MVYFWNRRSIFILACLGLALIPGRMFAYSASYSSADGLTAAHVVLSFVSSDATTMTFTNADGGGTYPYGNPNQPQPWTHSDVKAGIAVPDGTYAECRPGQNIILQRSSRPYVLYPAPYGSGALGTGTVFTVPLTGTGVPTPKITVSLFNSKDYPVTYVMMQNGVEIGRYTVGAGQGLIQSMDAPQGGDVSIMAQVSGLQFDGNQWQAVDGAVTSQAVGSVTPVIDGTTQPSTINEIDSPKSLGYGNPTPGTGGQSGRTIWKGGSGNNDPTQQKDLLTNPNYREGVDHIVEALKNSGALGDPAVGTNIDAIKKAITGQKKQHDDLVAATPGTDAMLSRGNSASDTAINIVNGQGGAAPTALPYAPDSGGDYHTALQIHFPAIFGGGTINLDPFSYPGLLTVCHWFREACKWLALVVLGTFIWREMADWIRGFSTVRQAQGNAVVGGTGAQATALIAAGLITTVIVVSVAGLMAWSFGDISFSAFRSMAISNPLVGIGAVSLGMLSEVLPVSTLVSCAVAKFTFNFYGSTVFAGASAIIRFIVP